MKSLTNTILFFNRSNRINLIKGNIKPFSIFINSKSNLINNMNKSNFKNFNNKLFTLSNNNNNLFNLQNKNFSGCGNGGCGSSNCSSHKPEEDEIEKNISCPIMIINPFENGYSSPREKYFRIIDKLSVGLRSGAKDYNNSS